MVWRDQWGRDPSLVIITPHPLTGGRLREAIVILRDIQHTAKVQVYDEHGLACLVTLPPTLLGIEDGGGETNLTLPARLL